MSLQLRGVENRTSAGVFGSMQPASRRVRHKMAALCVPLTPAALVS